MTDTAKHAFNLASETTLRRALDVSAQRGGEYLDSWHVDNQVSTFIDHVLALPILPGREREFKRLVMVAALIDVKDSRMSGPWKLDTVEDSINYRGAFAAWREEYAAFGDDAELDAPLDFKSGCHVCGHQPIAHVRPEAAPLHSITEWPIGLM